MDDALRGAIEADLGARIARAVPVHGGDVALVYAVELDDDRRVFAKTHPSPPPGFFTTEARGLSWLREAAAVAVPEVLAVSDEPPNRLVLEWIDEGPGRAEHGTGSRCRPRGACIEPARPRSAGKIGAARGVEGCRTSRARRGPSSTRRTASCRWPGWRATAARSRRRPSPTSNVSRAGSRSFDTGEPPARLHGDLWAGNRLVDVDGRSWLIDPAAHGGHREFDLAMMRLFGGFGADCFAAYADAYPLEPGWEGRVALHQIAPLVVHAIKFGGGYVGSATAAIAEYA